VLRLDSANGEWPERTGWVKGKCPDNWRHPFEIEAMQKHRVQKTVL
jgi:hypothetical protein